MKITLEIINRKNDALKCKMTINGVVNKRYYHSLNVATMAVKLNKLNSSKEDDNKIYLTGLLHDAAKLDSSEKLQAILLKYEKDNYLGLLNFPQIWHSFAGKYVVKDEFEIDDETILNAIYYHTTGRPNMSYLEQLIFVSDYIEETRVGTCFDVARAACYEDLNYGTYVILKQTIDYLKNNNCPIYKLTQEAFDYYKKYQK